MVDLPTLDLPAEDERLARLLIGFAEGDLNEAEMAEWDAALSQSEELQELLIATCLQRQLLPQVLADVANETPAVQPTIPPTSPVLGFLGNVTHGAYAYFSEGWPLAYLLGTIIFALGLGIFSLITVNHRTQIAEKCPSPSLKSSEPMPALVGRITGMIDAQWSDINTSTDLGNSVFLGRKYALASGLMEITYDTGAKVILQGPVTYEVDSPAGGYLSVGKLTARLEKKRSGGRGQGAEKVASGQWPVASETNPKSQNSKIPKSLASSPQPLVPSPSPNPQSQIPNPFVIHTPSAVVTDLGTEFGVEVDNSGVTQAHVFRGRVELRLADGGNDGISAIQLGENESGRVEPGRDRVPSVIRQAAQPAMFSRNMPRRVPIKLFNTGYVLKVGEPDPHWQIIARSDMPNFKPQQALVSRYVESVWAANDPAKSQWISAVADNSSLPNGVTYTFRTTFDLTGMRPETATLQGWFVVDNRIRRIRLNGHDVPAPKNGSPYSYALFSRFSVSQGFVKGVNVLEVEVENQILLAIDPMSPMGLRMELEGIALQNQTETQGSKDSR